VIEVRTTRPAPARTPPLALIVGVVYGLLCVLVWVILPTNWAFYVCAAALVAAAVPIAVELTGSIDDLLAFLLVFSLQFSSSFNLIYETKSMPGGAQGINITLVLLIAVAWWVWIEIRRMSGAALPVHFDRGFLKALVWFVIISGLSIVNAPTKQYTAWGLFYNTSMAVIALTAAQLCSTRKGLRILWTAAMVVIVSQTVVLLAQRALDISFSMNGDLLPNRGEEGRFGGTVGMAPANAATLMMILLFFVEKRLFAAARHTAWVTSGVFAAGGLSLLLSLTRSCWIGFTAGSAFLTWRALREGKVRPLRVVQLAAAAFVCVVIAWGPVHDRLGSNHRAAWEERWKLNYIDLEMIKAHPIVGVGLNNAYDSLKRYVPSSFSDSDWVYLAHNQFLHITAETGIVGLLSFLWILCLVLRRLNASRGTRDPLLKDTVTVMFAVIGSLIWGMQLDFYSGMQMYVLLWFMLGAAVGVSGLCVREKAQRRAVESAVRAAA